MTMLRCTGAALALLGALALGGCGCSSDATPNGGVRPQIEASKLEPSSQAGIEGVAGVGETLRPSILRHDPDVVTVLHFDLGRAPAAFGSAWLEVPLRCLDPDAPDGALSVHLFAGDGETSLDERAVGESLGTYGCAPGEYPVLQIVLTEQVRAFLDASHPYLSLRLRSEVGDERFDLGAVGGVDEPTITFWE